MPADLFGVPTPPARSSTNKVTSPPDRDDASDRLTFKQRREMDRLERLYLGNVPTADPSELAWRHAEWWTDRLRVIAAMHRAHLPAQRIERFCACGAGACVEVHRDTKRPRLRAFYCGDRACRPCSRARAAVVRRAVTEWASDGPCALVTLTLRNVYENCIPMLNAITDFFAQLRRMKFWRESVVGGAWVSEIKRGKRRRRWHVHIHAIVRTDGLSESLLRSAWLKITKHSHQVKVDQVTDPEAAGAYVAKYVTKGWSNEVLRDPDDLCECLLGLRGRRLFATFGSDRPHVAEREREDPANWKPVARLTVVIAAAESGEEWACGLLKGLSAKRRDDDGPTLYFGPLPAADPPDGS